MTVAYDQIVFIGYVIDTSPGTDANGKKYYPGLPVATQDIDARCQLMSQAMQAARGLIPQPSSPPASTLYVFMAPEFFFRGKAGAYSLDEVQYAITSLQAIAADGQWDDWLFGFGTIVGTWSNMDPEAQIVNFALVQLGGEAAQGADGARAIVKELQSNIDFIADNAAPGCLLSGAVAHPAPAKAGPGSEQQVAAYDGAGIFDLAGLTWAVEICLDYNLQRLQKSPQLPGEADVQVQLVPSCGADLKEGNAIAETGGYIFNVDGLGKQAHANLSQVATPMVPVALATNTPLSIASVTVANASPPLSVPVSDFFAGGSGSISVFTPVAVPAAGKVPGSTSVYVWNAIANPQWTFTFYLIYGDDKNFTDALCKIQSNQKDFRSNKYDLPVSLNLTFPPRPPEMIQRTGTIKIELRTGQGTYDNAIYADIRLPGFNFQGELIRFMTARESPDPVQTSWAK
jgi:hypothetical protein